MGKGGLFKDRQVKPKTNDEELENLIKMHQTVIKVVGTGGAGNNTISRLREIDIHGIETIAVNTDAQDLLFTNSENKLLIGKTVTRGLGAGSDPQVGEEAARENQEEVKAFLEGADIVFVTCGLGGGTGTGSAPVIAEIARSLEALTIAVVTLPFTEEGKLKNDNAASGLEKLRENADTVIVVKNDRLLELVPDLPINAAFKVADEILVNAVMGITELVTKKGLVNLDFADIKTIMEKGDTAMIGIGESEADNKVEEAVRKAVSNPLLDIDITGAKSALLHIEGDESMTIRDARNIMVAISKRLDPNAKIVWGASINQDIKNKIRVLIIATGLDSSLQNRPRATQTVSIPQINREPAETVNSEATTEAVAAKGEEESAEKPNKNVFHQIFEDDIKGDLNIMREAIGILSVNPKEDHALRNIKNAASGIKNAAQLYGNKPVEDFATFIADMFDLILSDRLKFHVGFLNLMKKVPLIMEGMISGYTVAIDDAQQVIEQMSLLLDQDGAKKSKPAKPQPPQPPENDSNGTAEEETDDDFLIDTSDLEDHLKMDLN
ncbi:cell division protein FtsZ [candidate division KSB1 bacterium 4484_87]|nr:MAG: cell division protein FtsZ [candidate division KSB1 bacterium 4484_87]